MTKFTKTDLAAVVAEQTGLARRDAMAAVDAVLASIRYETDAGKTVTLSGFGRFVVKERAARQGRNPATGEPIQIAASRALTFKASKPST